MAKKEKRDTSEYLAQSEAAAANSDKMYRDALQEYKDKIDRASRSNPLLDIVERSYDITEPDTSRYSRRRDRTAQAATMNALGELASVIGGGIAAAWGGTPPLPDKVSARLARARIADTDEKMHEEFDAYRKTNLAEAIRRDKQTERATEKYLDHLYRINRDDKRSRDAAALQTERKASSGSATRKTQSEKPVTYILDGDNKRVAIYRDQMTQLYELADEMGMLDKYRSAKNNDERKEALFVAIGKAYKEKQKIERLR